MLAKELMHLRRGCIGNLLKGQGDNPYPIRFRGASQPVKLPTSDKLVDGFNPSDDVDFFGHDTDKLRLHPGLSPRGGNLSGGVEDDVEFVMTGAGPGTVDKNLGEFRRARVEENFT